jgi:Flp pilus assembly secretin CpaC
MAGQVTTVEVASHFVTAIRLPEAISSVAVGDPALFEVEHSEREPQLLFVTGVHR